MIKPTTPEPLEHAVATATAHQGITITTADGRPAELAIVADGQVIESGPHVARILWQIARTTFTNFMRGQGFMVVASAPPTTLPAERRRA